MVIIEDCSHCFYRFHHFYDIHYETNIKNWRFSSPRFI